MRSDCIDCVSVNNSNQLGLFRRLINRSRTRQTAWNQTQSQKACIFDIDVEFLEHLHTIQNGNCFYSGMNLSTTPLSHWQCSLERTNPSLGYCRQNVALVALEFNARKQWSKEKVAKIPQKIYEPINITYSDFISAKKSRIPTKSPHNKKRHDNNGKYFCFACNTWKRHDLFSLSQPTRCKQCHSNNVQAYCRDTIRGFVMKKFHSARGSCQKKKPFTEICENRATCTMTVDDI